MNTEEIVNLCRSKGVGVKMVEGGIVVMDTTQLPGAVAALFDQKGFLAEEVEAILEVKDAESEPVTKRTKKDSK